jgi:hypothetical protein
MKQMLVLAAVLTASSSGALAQTRAAIDRSARAAANAVAPDWVLQPPTSPPLNQLHWKRGQDTAVVTWSVHASEQEAAARLRRTLQLISVGGIQLERGIGDEGYILSRYTPAVEQELARAIPPVRRTLGSAPLVRPSLNQMIPRQRTPNIDAIVAKLKARLAALGDGRDAKSDNKRAAYRRDYDAIQRPISGLRNASRSRGGNRAVRGVGAATRGLAREASRDRGVARRSPGLAIGLGGLRIARGFAAAASISTADSSGTRGLPVHLPR